MDRFLLVLCSIFLAIGMVSLVFPDGVAAIGVVVLVSTLALLVFRQFTSEREFLTNLFIAALLLRILFGVMVHVLDMRGYFGGDADTYDFKGYTLAEYWLGNLFANDPAVIAASAKTGSGWGMNYLVAVLYIVFGHNIFAAQSFCAVIGAATAPMTYYCSKKLFGNIRVAKIAAVAVAFFPAFVIWSGQLLKDGIIVFLLVLVMTLVLHLQEKFSWTTVIMLVLAMFGIMTIRFYIFYMVAIAVVGSFIIGVTNSMESIIRRTIALVVIGLGLTYFGVSRTATTDLGTYGNLDQLERSRSDLIRSANSGYKDDSDVSTSSGAISALPLGFIYLMFAPFPWQAGGSARQTFTIPEVLFWWAMLPVVVYGLWYTIKERLRPAFPVLLFTLMLTLAYSIFLGNVGTAYRQRTQIQVFLFMFFGVGWTLFQEKRANARMLREASGRRLEHALRRAARLSFSMCGITGFVNNGGRQADSEILSRMNAAIVHRGPDEDGFYVHENVGLAMRRLSIIDLAGGQQPISNADKTKWIVFNGEIYNYRELRKELDRQGHKFYTNSDTEAIVHLYDQYGPDCLQRLRGMFAFAIWDEIEKALFIARDRVGKKPLLYSHQPNGDLIFGSEFQALLQHPSVSREVDFEAIDNYLSYLCVPAPQTAFKAIRKLEPGHWLRWKNGQVETHRYWLPDFTKKIKISENDAIEETTRILRESTRMRLISEVPLGAFLSGGVDSSTVVALMAEASDKPVKTFSIGFEEQDYSELKYARRVAEHVGAEYNEFIVKPNALEILPTLVRHYGEPYADSSAVPTYYVARETREHVTVALNGDGGDESFAGYERHAAMMIADRYQRIPRFMRKAFVEAPINAFPTSEIKRSRVRDAKRFLKVAGLPKTERYFRWMSTFDVETKKDIYTSDFSQAIAGVDPSKSMEKWFAKVNGSGILDAALLNDLMTYLPNDLLVKVDIATMANSLEARSPFLDHKVIEFAASLPESLKMRGFATKSLLKKVAERLVPKEVIYRRKMGFGVPIGKWFRTDMKDFLKEVLLSERSLKRGIIRPQAIEQYVIRHIAGEKDYSFQLWSLLMLELWFREFID